jgi:esterase/lipase superfamily enzyme
MRMVELDGGTLACYGHWGRPLIAFPSEAGDAWDWDRHGLVHALGPLLDDGRLKLYCVPSFERESWTRHELPLEERALIHGRYEWWLVNQVVPFVQADSRAHEILLAGPSFGAYHAANFCLRRADLFPAALCLSGIYDVGAVYFHNPLDYVANLNGDHLDWLRGRVSLLLVCGQGQWEDTTGALESTKRFGSLLAEKGIRHEVDLWGHDVPHDWPSWQRQLTHHLPRFL